MTEALDLETQEAVSCKHLPQERREETHSVHQAGEDSTHETPQWKEPGG
jgi:hypothetical protein